MQSNPARKKTQDTMWEVKQFTFKSVNEEGDNFRLQGSCGQGIPLLKRGAEKLLLIATFYK